MAINFPDSPSNGDTFTANGKTFVYNSTNTSWRPQTAAESGGTDVLADMASLIAKTGMSNGDQAVVQSNNNLYMYLGSGWYKIATIQNDAPSAITGVDGTYALATDGTATTITAVSTDPEGFALTWSYTASGLGSIATVSQADNVFTVTPSTDAANFGSFTLTISATDGINGAVSTVPSFTLAFSVTNSRYTALSVKATATGSNQTFDDASSSNHTITVTNDTKTTTFSPYRHGGYSAYFDGTGDSLSIPTSTDFALGTGDFTVDFWVYQKEVKDYTIYFDYRTTTENTLYLYGLATGVVDLHINGVGHTFTPPSMLNKWSHIAIARSGNLTKLFVDGVQYLSFIDNADYVQGGTFYISRYYASDTYNLNGYMRDFRWVKGTCLYTSAFTPPTEPLTAITNTKLLIGSLPYFKDQSTSNHTITVAGNAALKPLSLFDNAPYSEASHGASAYFDGIGPDKLDLAANSDFLLDGEFTIDFWFNADTVSPDYYERTLFKIGNGSGSGTSTFIYLTQSGSTETGKICFTHSTGQTVTTDGVRSGDTAISSKTWNHVAITRDSGNALKMWLNGDLVETNTNRTVNYGSSSVGPSFGYNTTDGKYKGYISDFRIIKGTCLYTANFTPPTAPLTAITNTKFLLNPETSISDLSQSSAIKCFGDAATSTTQVKFAGTKSIAFDGTGDYISAEDDASFSFGTGDFTVECWLFHQNASASYYDLIGTARNSAYMGSNRGGWIFSYYHNAGTVKFGYQYSSSWVSENSFTQTLNADTWYHLAISRQGNQLKCFVDGTQVGSTITNSSNIISTEPLTIGTGAGTSTYVNGYMQDVRITRGLARYTANFTPPTAELQG